MSENGVLTCGAPQSKRGGKSMVLILIIMAVVAVVGIVRGTQRIIDKVHPSFVLRRRHQRLARRLISIVDLVL